MTGPTPGLTTVVIGYRDDETIAAAIESVVDQVDEVVVVTSGRHRLPGLRSETLAAITHVASAERLMPGGARNLGLDHAGHQHIAFLAADCVAVPGWAAARLAAHRAGHEAVAGSVGLVEPRRPWGVAAWLLSYRNRLPGRAAGSVDPRDPRAHGLSVTRALVERVGLFDPSLRIGEDTEFADRVFAAGASVWFEPAAEIRVRGPRFGWSLPVDEFRRGVREGRLSRTAPGVAGRGAGKASLRPFRRARAALAMGARDGALPRLAVVLAAPWVVLGSLARTLGARWGSRSR